MQISGHDLNWRDLTDRDLPLVAALSTRCLAADGGLPLAATQPFLARRFAAPGGTARGLVDGTGALLAAGAVGPTERDGQPGAAVTGMVDPAHRGRGFGGQLLDWGLAAAAPMAPTVVVETESLTDPAARLFTARGLHQVFAEDVMRFDLAASPIPEVALPMGISVEQWSAALAGRFFRMYEAAFGQRPGFPGWPATRWVDWTAGDDDFRPDCSLLAVDPVAGDLGFITCSDGWIVQVGVRPDQRGRGIGAALVAEALHRMLKAGVGAVMLDVNVDNLAGELYARLGFVGIGRRARFAAEAG